MKPGDKVRCVREDFAFNRLDADTVYTIEGVKKGSYDTFYCLDGYWVHEDYVRPEGPKADKECAVCGATSTMYCDPDMPGRHKLEPATPQPSKEALEMATTLLARASLERTAAALQKLMDERDCEINFRKNVQEALSREIKRAEAAEKLADERFECVRKVFTARAEEAEAKLVKYEESMKRGLEMAKQIFAKGGQQYDRAEAAEARLAECVREIRQWENGSTVDGRALLHILRKYEAPK